MSAELKAAFALFGSDDEGDAAPTPPAVIPSRKPAARRPTRTPALWQNRPPAYLGPVDFVDNLAGVGGLRGFVASEDLPPGTLLLSEEPVLTWPEGSEDEPPSTQIFATILALLEKVKANEDGNLYRDLLQLHPKTLHDVPPDMLQKGLESYGALITSIIQELKASGENNSDIDINMEAILRLYFAFQFNGFGSGLYLHLSIFNHACAPNCIKFTPDSATGDQRVSEIRTVTHVKKGDEMLICYLVPQEQLRATRQKGLMEAFYFECKCRLCTSPHTPVQESVLCSTCGAASDAISKATPKLPTDGTHELGPFLGQAPASVGPLSPTCLTCQTRASDAALTAVPVAEWERAVDAGEDVPPSEVVTTMDALLSQMRTVLHPYHYLIFRATKAKVAALGFLLSGEVESDADGTPTGDGAAAAPVDPADRMVAFIRGSLDLQKLLPVLFSPDHPDCAQAASDLAQASRTLLSMKPAALFTIPEVGTTSAQAVKFAAQQNSTFQRIRGYYST